MKRRKIILKFCAAGLFFSLLSCSCASISPNAIAPASQLPADVVINQEAGRGGNLIVMLRLENGEELPFVVDSGAEGTLLDKSLVPKLGKRLGAVTLTILGAKEKANLYAAPKLYLGNTRLITGGNIAIHDFKAQSLLLGRPVMGVLGMDCLKHYCIQLNFETEEMHFLNPDQVDVQKIGKAFPLMMTDWNLPFIHGADLYGGENMDSLIDTGCFSDGFIIIKKRPTKENDSEMTLPACIWNDGIYTNLFVGNGASVIGLRFLARHLVTLNFPKQMIYLKQTNVGPLMDKAVEAAMGFLHDLKEKNQLLGWSKNEKGTTAMPQTESNSVTVNIEKRDDSSIYHYTVSRTDKNNLCKLEKAWRTDKNGNTIEEFPIP